MDDTILDKIYKAGVFDVDLLHNKKSICIEECCDNCFDIELNKK